MNILREYNHIMKKEMKFLNDLSLHFVPPKEIYGTALQLAEVAKSCFVPRVYLDYYSISSADQAHESVSAHTNLLRALLDRYLSYKYGVDFGKPGGENAYTIDGFSYREIMEAATLHDLPENDIGDIPDNGAHDKEDKRRQEKEYIQDFAKKYPEREKNFCQHVTALFYLMDDLNSPTGSIMRVADKTAAVFMALTYDAAGMPPLIAYDNPRVSDRDREEMSLCDTKEGNFYYGSEMWTIDLLQIRKFVNLDESNFFLSLIVMYTLMVKGHWYNWRERNYLDV